MKLCFFEAVRCSVGDLGGYVEQGGYNVMATLG